MQLSERLSANQLMERVAAGEPGYRVLSVGGWKSLDGSDCSPELAAELDAMPSIMAALAKKHRNQTTLTKEQEHGEGEEN